MKEITINCAGIGTMAEIHDLLSRELCFPDWYGRNLDALHDCLCSLGQDTRLNFLHFSALPFPTGGLLKVLADCENQNPHLEISLVNN